MNFPPDAEIRQYAAYYIRAIGIFKEEFKNSQGRPPTEFEIQDFSKMGIIPYGLVPKNGGSSGFLQQNANGQKLVQDDANKPLSQNAQGMGKPVGPEGGRKSEVLRLLNEFPQNLERKSQSKIKIIKEIPRSDWNEVKEGFEKEGWKYDWKEKAFLVSGEAKA